MMREYNPDKWVLIRVVKEDGTILYKIMATFYGGFAVGDEWKLSSRVESCNIVNGVFEFNCYSGSKYMGALSNYGMGMYTAGVYNSYQKQAHDTGNVIFEAVNDCAILNLVKEEGWLHVKSVSKKEE